MASDKSRLAVWFRGNLWDAASPLLKSLGITSHNERTSIRQELRRKGVYYWQGEPITLAETK